MFSSLENKTIPNAHVLQMDAEHIGFKDGTFEAALCGFLGWDYCFDFVRNEFTRPDTRSLEIARVLKKGGQIWISQWTRQENLDWMEERFIRTYPAVEHDAEFVRRRPIGYSRENADAYVKILKNAGYEKIEIRTETTDLVAAHEDAWWREVGRLGWSGFLKRVQEFGSTPVDVFKESVFKNLQSHRQPDGIHFTKTVNFARGEKQTHQSG